MAIIDGMFWALGILVLLAIFYIYFLAVVSLLPERKKNISRTNGTKFAIVIPAHNESSVIKKTFKSIGELNYPDELYEIIVFADNCDDNTAAIAKDCGAICFERRDFQKMGKGFALRWGFDRLKANNTLKKYDAFVVIDADTLIHPDFLNEMDGHLSQGKKVIQGYYDVIDPGMSPMSSLSYFGFAISRNLRYKGRTKLGWSNNLLGNGMCFSAEVIDRFGWCTTSIVEDIEYAVILLLNGIKITFAAEARLFAEIPNTFKKSKVQRARWDIGKFKLRNRYLGPLIARAIKNKDLSCLDMAMELLIPPFSFFILLVFSLFFFFMMVAFTSITPLSIVWFSIVIALIFYISVGVATAKTAWRSYLNLVYAPFFLIWRVKTVIWGYLFRVGNKWIKTEREENKEGAEETKGIIR